MPFATTHLNQDVTLTFDLQHLIRSSVWASEYFLSVVAFVFSDYPKWERLGEFHFSYYASSYNTVETNQPPIGL